MATRAPSTKGQSISPLATADSCKQCQTKPSTMPHTTTVDLQRRASQSGRLTSGTWHLLEPVGGYETAAGA